MTKDAIRHKVWTRVTAAGVVRFPGRVRSHPELRRRRARRASCSAQLTIWKRAKVVKFDLGAPQLALRRAALRDGKILYIPMPGLRTERCFLEVDPARLGANAVARGEPARRAARTAVRWRRTSCIRSTWCWSARSRCRARARASAAATARADLEYALLRRAGKVREYTPIVTTVHPLQVVDDRIAMRAHDIPVDFLITPDQVVAAPSLYPRPRGILWDLLPDERIRAIPALRKGRREGRGTLTPGPDLIRAAVRGGRGCLAAGGSVRVWHFSQFACVRAFIDGSNRNRRRTERGAGHPRLGRAGAVHGRLRVDRHRAAAAPARSGRIAARKRSTLVQAVQAGRQARHAGRPAQGRTR